MALPKQQPGKLQGTQGPSPAAQADAPKIEAWGDVELFPSVLITGKTGTGKTDAIGKLCEAGFVCVVVTVEDKRASLQRWRPKILDMNKIIESGGSKRMPTTAEKYRRLMTLQDQLRAGEHREHEGQVVDILAVDSLTEISDIIAGHILTQEYGDRRQAWGDIGAKTIDFFKGCRDAAGYAAAKLGARPMGVMATCLEADLRKINPTGPGYITEVNVPVLQGNMAMPRLAPAFEVAWRLSAGRGVSGTHEFRVHTQACDEYEAKSPAGIFEEVVVGPGGVGNAPDVGEMYKMLLEHEDSPYRRSG